MLVIVCKTCGNEFKVFPYDIKKGTKKFCSFACKKAGMSSIMQTHGASRTRLYTIWRLMRARCHNENREEYQYYGGRGIDVCDEWNDSFEVFRTWALENGYSERLELDREDPDGNYSPSNCRWTTRNNQMANTRKRQNASTSRYKGVCWCKITRKWKVQIQKDKKHYHIGLSRNEEEAARMYDKAARDFFGPYAHTNFPTNGGVQS